MKNLTCCICGKEAEDTCNHCENAYCSEHFKTTVMTGNCCRSNEEDYEN